MEINEFINLQPVAQLVQCSPDSGFVKQTYGFVSPERLIVRNAPRYLTALQNHNSAVLSFIRTFWTAQSLWRTG
jgi:hypothetical protein